jgi:hypothetical protein
MVLGKINRLCAGSVWRFGRQELAENKGLIRRRRGDARTAPGELEAAF